MVFPEIISIVIFLILKGMISLGDRNRMEGAGLCSRTIIHIGRISYSGYVFHLFVLDFWLHFIGQHLDYGSGVSLGISFIAYYCILVAFSHVTYNAIELPFLRFRHVYQEHSASVNTSRWLGAVPSIGLDHSVTREGKRQEPVFGDRPQS
jgi:peptidoglycan/LPS O-acetylase OafA/YrhL